MDAHLELVRRMAGAQTRLAVTIDQWPEPVRLAADDRDHQRQPERAGANEGTGRAADTEPNRQRILKRARGHSPPSEGRAGLARPVDTHVAAEVHKQIGLLPQKRTVVLR